MDSVGEKVKMEYDDDNMTQSEVPELTVPGPGVLGGCRTEPPDKEKRTSHICQVDIKQVPCFFKVGKV
jgi:hypothetical protein